MPWRRRRKSEAGSLPSPEVIEAIKAIGKADRDLEETQERNEEIESTVELVIHYGDRNNFADLIREALGGTP